MAEPPPQRAMNLLVIGQSHVAAIRAAAKAHREAQPAGPRTRVIHTLETHLAPEMEGIAEAGGDWYAAARFGAALTHAIEEQVARHAPRVVSVMGGNAHNMIGLVRHPRPFDFRLSGEDSPPLDPEAEPIPEALVRAALTDRLQHDFARLRLLRDLAGPFIHVESPPPVADESIIAAQAEIWFGIVGGGATAIAPPGLRYRVWRLNSRLFRDAVEALGGRFMPVPQELRDDAGFLRAAFAGDATHGNQAYGEAVIRALEAMGENLPNDFLPGGGRGSVGKVVQ